MCLMVLSKLTVTKDDDDDNEDEEQEDEGEGEGEGEILAVTLTGDELIMLREMS